MLIRLCINIEHLLLIWSMIDRWKEGGTPTLYKVSFGRPVRSPPVLREGRASPRDTGVQLLVYRIGNLSGIMMRTIDFKGWLLPYNVDNNKFVSSTLSFDAREKLK